MAKEGLALRNRGFEFHYLLTWSFFHDTFAAEEGVVQRNRGFAIGSALRGMVCNVGYNWIHFVTTH